MAKVAERKILDARSAIMLTTGSAASNTLAAQSAASVVSAPAVSLLNRGQSSSSLGGQVASPQKQVSASNASQAGGDSSPREGAAHKKTQAQNFIDRLPLLQILQGQSLGRTLTPAATMVDKWRLDKDDKVRNNAAVLQLHLEKCEKAEILANEVGLMSTSALNDTLQMFKSYKVELPKELKDKLVARRVADLCRTENYKELLKVSAPWKTEAMQSEEWDSMDPHFAHVEGSSKEEAFTFASVLAEDVLLATIRQEQAGFPKLLTFCELALQSFDDIDEEIDEEYAAVLESLLHLFRCILALLHPRPGVYGSGYEDVRTVNIDAFVPPSNTELPWLMTVGAGLKSHECYNTLLQNYTNTHELTLQAWRKLSKWFDDLDEERTPSLSNEDMVWACTSLQKWRVGLRKGLAEQVEALLLQLAGSFVAAANDALLPAGSMAKDGSGKLPMLKAILEVDPTMASALELVQRIGAASSARADETLYDQVSDALAEATDEWWTKQEATHSSHHTQKTFKHVYICSHIHI